MCISNDIQTTFFYLGRSMKEVANNQCPSITKTVSTISNIMSIQPFTMGVEIEQCLIFEHTAFLPGMVDVCIFIIPRNSIVV